MNKNINKYLDLCLKCGKCSDFCPSDIDIVDVILSAKAEYFKNSFEGKILSIIHSKPIFNTALSITRFLFGDKKKYTNSSDKKAVYFGGCIENIFPKPSSYIKSLLNEMEIEVADIKFNCCGLPFLTSGNIERFLEQVNENIEKINGINIDYFVTDCASCKWTWEKYINYNEDETLKQKFKQIQFKTIYELILEHGLEFISKKPYNVVYHKPCHEIGDTSEQIIRDIQGINLVEYHEKSNCCGFSEILKPSAWSTVLKITKSKRNSINKISPQYILTTCVGCLISLSLITKFRYKTKRLISFLAENCKLL